MLNKLFKYDFLSTMKIFGGMAAGMLLYSLVASFLYSDTSRYAPMLIFILSSILMTVTVASLVLVIQSYNKTLFSDTGYLMFTLPVRPEMLVLSKVLISMFWFVVMVLSTGASFLLFFRVPPLTLLRLAERLDKEDLQSLASVGLLFFLIALFLIVTAFLSIAVSYGPVKNKTVGGILCFVVFNVLLYLQSLACKYIFGLGTLQIIFGAPGMQAAASSIPMSLFSVSLSLLLFSVLEYFGICLLLKHRLNLQ